MMDRTWRTLGGPACSRRRCAGRTGETGGFIVGRRAVRRLVRAGRTRVTRALNGGDSVRTIWVFAVRAGVNGGPVFIMVVIVIPCRTPYSLLSFRSSSGRENPHCNSADKNGQPEAEEELGSDAGAIDASDCGVTAMESGVGRAGFDQGQPTDQRVYQEGQNGQYLAGTIVRFGRRGSGGRGGGGSGRGGRCGAT